MARPILSSLLASKTISDEEKNAILDYLGGVENIDESTVQEASQRADNSSAVLNALMDMFTKRDYKPEPPSPTQPVSEPSSKTEPTGVQEGANPQTGVEGQGDISNIIAELAEGMQ